MQTVVAFLACVVVLAGCSITLISAYDEQTDQAVTQLQKDMETLFLTLEGQAGTSQCAHRNHTQFYQDTEVALSSLSVRTNALPNNEITSEQVRLLSDSVGTLEQRHKLGCPSPSEIEALRSSFNSTFTAILTLELAKKRGL